MSYTYISDVVQVQPVISNVEVGTTATPLPATPMAGRNCVLIRNTSNFIVHLCNEDGSGSFELEPGETLKFLTENDTPRFFARVNVGLVTVDVMEWY